MDMDNNEKKKVLEVQVVGKNRELWGELRDKLMMAVTKTLDTVINHENNTSIRDEAKEFASALIDHAKAKLKRAGLENEKIIAEIDNLYVRREKELAETRKLNAEAKSIEIKNRIKSLKISLGGMKVLMIGQDGEEDLLFIKQIDAFLNVLNSMEE